MSLWLQAENIQKRLLKFVLKRTMGQFLAEELDLSQLEVSFGLGGGSVNLYHVELKVDALNELLLRPNPSSPADRHLRARVQAGSIASIFLNIPWSDFWNGFFLFYCSVLSYPVLSYPILLYSIFILFCSILSHPILLDYVLSFLFCSISTSILCLFYYSISASARYMSNSVTLLHSSELHP